MKANAAVGNEPEARRDQVLRVAEALFARAGYRGVGLREIAAQVGIRAPSLFKHFRSKQALYNAVLLSIFDRLLEVAKRLEGNTPFAVRLEDFIGGYVDLVANDPHVVPLLFRELMERSEAMNPDTRGYAEEIFRRIDAFLAAGQRAAEFRPVDRFRFQIAISGAILYHGLAAKPYQAVLLDRPTPDRAAWKRTVLDIARATLLARPADTPRAVTARPRRPS